MNNKKEILILSDDKVIFNDNKKTMMIRGHFHPYVCGTVTSLQKAGQAGMLNAGSVWSGDKDFDHQDNNHIQGMIKFNTIKDYRNAKEMVKEAFEAVDIEWYGEKWLEKLIREKKKEVSNKNGK